MLPWLNDAAGARSQTWYQRPGVAQEGGGGCQEQDEEGTDMQSGRREAEGLGPNDPQLHRPQQVSILDGLVGEEASMSVVRGGARW